MGGVRRGAAGRQRARAGVRARAQASIGEPAEFTPVCDNGLHLRLLADHAPTKHRLEYIASLEGEPEPWVHGDWAKQGPPPERNGVPQWTVDVDVMVRGDDWDWPPKVEHADAERLTQYGWGRGLADLRGAPPARAVEVVVTTEQAALDLTHRLVGEHFTRPYVIAHRVCARLTPGEWEDKPRKPEDLEGGVFPVPWQRADVDRTTLTIAWRERGEAFDHVTADEQPDRVTVTVHERFNPIWTEDGHHIAFAGPDMFRLDGDRTPRAASLRSESAACRRTRDIADRRRFALALHGRQHSRRWTDHCSQQAKGTALAFARWAVRPRPVRGARRRRRRASGSRSARSAGRRC